MDLEGFFGSKPPVIDLHAENRWEAIDELINYLVATQKIKEEHREQIRASVRQREPCLEGSVPHPRSRRTPRLCRRRRLPLAPGKQWSAYRRPFARGHLCAMP